MTIHDLALMPNEPTIISEVTFYFINFRFSHLIKIALIFNAEAGCHTKLENSVMWEIL